MSHRPSNGSRQRSASNKPKRNYSNLPEEYISPATSIKPRIISAIRIEERLLNQQITYKKRLESLKKNIEQEQMREIRSKPKISEKSRVLAEKAEKRMLQQYSDIKDPQPDHISESVYSQVQPDYSIRTSSGVKTPKNEIDSAPKAVKNVKKRTKSLLNLTVLERNEAWLEEKKNKIGVRKKAKEEKELDECTFSPKTQNKNKQNKSVRENISSNISYLSSPYSIDNYEYSEQNSRIGAGRLQAYRPIAPFQVNVSFKCGIDLNSFLKRAK